MKALKIHAGIISVLALLYAVGGVSALIARDMEINITALRAFGRDVEPWRKMFLYSGITYISLSILIGIAAFGIFKAKEWARRFWFIVSGIILIDLIVSLTTERNDLLNYIVYIVSGAIVLYTLVYLNLRKVKNIFQGAT